MNINWLSDHGWHIITALVGMMGFGIAKFHGSLVSFVEKREEICLDKILFHLKRPEDRIAFKAILEAVRVRFPDAGAACYAVAADAICTKFPEARLFREQIILFFKIIEQGSVAAIQSEEKKF